MGLPELQIDRIDPLQEALHRREQLILQSGDFFFPIGMINPAALQALRMPRVSLFIADDVGLGKTIEAGLIMRELLLRPRAAAAPEGASGLVVVAPPSVVLQWKGEMESRFGLGFAVMDRQSIAEMRQQRGWGINPWATHTRFIISQALVRDEARCSAITL